MNWEAVTAIATVVIALILSGTCVAAIAAMRKGIHLAENLQGVMHRLEVETRPMLESAKTAVSETTRVAGRLHGELDNIVDTTSDVRERVERAVHDAEARLIDLEALMDVMQDEIEETVLDVGAALRMARKGTSLVGTVRRALTRGKRKRKKRRKRG